MTAAGVYTSQLTVSCCCPRGGYARLTSLTTLCSRDRASNPSPVLQLRQCAGAASSDGGRRAKARVAGLQT